MFKQIHRTIKGLAIVCAVIGGLAIPVGIIIDIALWGEGLFLGTVSGGGIVLLIQSWFVYGFGQLIENSQRTATLLEQQMIKSVQNESSIIQADQLPDL